MMVMAELRGVTRDGIPAQTPVICLLMGEIVLHLGWKGNRKCFTGSGD